MSGFICKKAKFLSDQEKKEFTCYLKENGLADNVWDFFDELISISTRNTDFFYIKVMSETGLVGVGFFLKVRPYDFGDANSALKNNLFIKNIVTRISSLFNHCVYFSFRFLTANLTRPFFFKSAEFENPALSAILAYIKEENEANMIIIMDASQSEDSYALEGFSRYKAPSEAWIEPTRFADISDYLNGHKSLKKHIAQKKKKIVPEFINGPISRKDIDDMIECLKHSIDNSKMNTPLQKLFEEYIYESDLFTSDKYIFINIRLDGKIVGFTNYIVSGAHMAAIIGGYNRKYTRNNYIYERLFVNSLDFAIKHDISRLCYGMVDNLTKLRLTEAFDPIRLYIYSANPIFRKMIDLTQSTNDIQQLCRMEESGRKKYHSL